jgi:hypothetical protein
MKTDGIYLGASFALSGPVDKLDATRLPVRGDLAHIRLAGKSSCRIMSPLCSIAPDRKAPR